MRMLYHVMAAPSPLGLLFLAASERGLSHVEFMDRRSLKRTIAAHAERHPGAAWEPSVHELRPLADQLDQYFTGTRTRIEWPLDPVGEPFDVRVWAALADVPFGRVTTYAALTRALGEPPRAMRLVAIATHRNPLAIVVPSHRVVATDGKLAAYPGGLPRKKFLLALEARFKDALPLDANRVIHDLTVHVAAPVAPPAAPRRRRAAARPAKNGASVRAGAARRGAPRAAAPVTRPRRPS